MGIRRLGAALGGTLLLTLLLWVSSARSAPVFQHPRLTFEIRLPHASRDAVDTTPPGFGGPRGTGPGGGTPPWYLNPLVLSTTLVSVIVGAVFLVGLVWGLRELARLRRLSRLRDDRWGRTLVADLLGDHVRASRERLAQGPARNAIVGAWPPWRTEPRRWGSNRSPPRRPRTSPTAPSSPGWPTRNRWRSSPRCTAARGSPATSP